MSHKTLLVPVVFAGLFTTQVFADEVKFDNYACFVAANHIVQHADGYLAGSFDGAFVVQGPQSDPLYMTSAHCVGTYTVVGGEEEDNGGCETVNAAGEKLFSVFVRKGDPTKVEGSFRLVHGTGKFAGVRGGGKYKDTGTYPPSAPNTINGCFHQWGAYEVTSGH